jgi:hypothetical protein
MLETRELEWSRQVIPGTRASKIVHSGRCVSCN